MGLKTHKADRRPPSGWALKGVGTPTSCLSEGTDVFRAASWKIHGHRKWNGGRRGLGAGNVNVSWGQFIWEEEKVLEMREVMAKTAV